MHDHSATDDADEGPSRGRRARRKLTDFDCPVCSANNPVDDGFGNGDELLCNYCGLEFRASIDEDGRLRLKEI